MRKGIWTTVAGCLLGLASQAVGATHSGDTSHLVEPNSCRTHLHALVAYLKETAQLEGRMLIVEWHRDNSVVLRCTEFRQHMWCQDEELHIEYSDVVPEALGN